MSILNEIQENKKLIHITTKEIADKISIEGFKPVKRLEFKYYSELGENGIYFYDNFRQAQQYAYWLSNKDKIDKVAVIITLVPENIIQKSSKLEEGLFVSVNNLNKIKIKKEFGSFYFLERPSNLY